MSEFIQCVIVEVANLLLAYTSSPSDQFCYEALPHSVTLLDCIHTAPPYSLLQL